jgi:transposase
MSTDDSLPDDVETLKSMLIAERAARMAAEGEAQHRALLIEKLKYTIRKLRHERFGQSSERGTLLDQLELQLADLEEDAAQAEAAAAMAAASDKITVPSFERRKPARRPCRNTCRASASSIRCRQPARAAAVGPCARSART